MAGILKGSLAVVTGAGSGVGRSTCQILSREEAIVIATDKNLAAAEETIKKFTIPSSEDHSFLFLDLRVTQSIKQALELILKKYKRPPTIVVNTGGLIRDYSEMTELEYDSVMNVNMKGTFLMMQASAKAMVEANVPQGCIVNISSVLGKIGCIGQINHIGSKAGVTGLTKSASKEFGQYNIRVNAVLSGLIETPMVDHISKKIKDSVIKETALKRMGKPEEVAEVIVFLCSEKCSFITGATVDVSGGFRM